MSRYKSIILIFCLIRTAFFYILNFLLFTFLLFKHAVKILPFVIKYVPDQYNTQEICDKAVDKYAHALEFVPDCIKTQKMSNKAANTYFSTVQFVPESYRTQEMYNKAVATY